MITVSNLTKSYGALQVLRGVDAHIEKGEVVSIIGPSGTGKSTFLRCLNMLDPPTSGSIVFEGEDITLPSADLNRVRRKMGMVFQSFNLFSHLSVMDNLTVGQIKLLGIRRPEAEEKGRELLAMVGLAEKADSYPDELSGGQKQRVAIARCLAMRPEIMLFDEPTSALDPTMVGEVTAVIRRLARDGMTMAIVSHEMDFCRNVSNRVFYMDEGGIYEEGPPETVFGQPLREKTRAFIRRVRSFAYHVGGRDFDFIELMNNLREFCRAHDLDRAAANRLQLVVEETVVNLLAPLNVAVDIDVSFPEDRSYHRVRLEYDGPSRNPLEDGDELAAQMVRGIAGKVDYSFAEKNRLTIEW